MPRPLFAMGNKRSGSTLLVNLLNQHPKVFVSHESDIAWILYQSRNGLPEEVKCHPFDAPRGLNSTLKACGSILRDHLKPQPVSETIQSTFYEVQRHLMTNGSDMDKSFDKSDCQWIGDKKPVQHCIPEINSFLRQHFDDALYIHVIRNPKCVVASMLKAADSWKFVPDYWQGTKEEIFSRWLQHEAWVLQAKSEMPDRIYTLQLEHLCASPIIELEKLFSFLDLNLPESLASRIDLFIDERPNTKYDSFELPQMAGAKDILRHYDY